MTGSISLGVIMKVRLPCCRSQWPRGIRRRFAAARLLRLWVRIPPGAWMSLCCECCVFCQLVSQRRIDHSSRGVLPTVVRRCVWSINLIKNDEAMARVGLQRHGGWGVGATLLHPKQAQKGGTGTGIALPIHRVRILFAITDKFISCRRVLPSRWPVCSTNVTLSKTLFRLLWDVWCYFVCLPWKNLDVVHQPPLQMGALVFKDTASTVNVNTDTLIRQRGLSFGLKLNA